MVTLDHSTAYFKMLHLTLWMNPVQNLLGASVILEQYGDWAHEYCNITSVDNTSNHIVMAGPSR